MNVQIEIWISGDQEEGFYNSMRSKRFKILQNNEFDETVFLTKGVFPTFVISKNQKLIKRWTNQYFGARALDEIESFFEVHN